jgi:hypothetical protein
LCKVGSEEVKDEVVRNFLQALEQKKTATNLQNMEVKVIVSEQQGERFRMEEVLDERVGKTNEREHGSCTPQLDENGRVNKRNKIVQRHE